MKGDDGGASELIDETLIIAMGLVLAVVIGMLMFGVLPFTDKTAYLVPQFSIVNVSGHTVIAVFDRGGEPVYFNGSLQAKYKADLYVDTQSHSYKAVPAPALTVLKPGDTVYAYYTGSGFVLTKTLSGLTFPSLPAGKIAVRFVDTTSGVLIAKEDLVNGAATATTTVTTAVTTATATPTTSTTATTSTTTTTSSTTATSTTATPLPALTASFTWGPAGASNTVKFTDASTGSPTSWSWNFGDGATGSGQSVNHHYATGGSRSVKLTVTRLSDGATSSITKTVTV